MANIVKYFFIKQEEGINMGFSEEKIEKIAESGVKAVLGGEKV